MSIWRKQKAEAGWPQVEIDATFERYEKARSEGEFPRNEARLALEKYWGQFL